MPKPADWLKCMSLWNIRQVPVAYWVDLFYSSHRQSKCKELSWSIYTSSKKPTQIIQKSPSNKKCYSISNHLWHLHCLPI